MKTLRFGLFALLTLAMTGCGLSFERDWRAARDNPFPEDQLAGRWEGTWHSDYNGHNGRLRAIITRCNECGRYHAHYHATFAGVIPYAYETVHSARSQNGSTQFWGDEDLGYCAGGHYHYNGCANGCTFFARYKADKDHGTFRMQRVRAGDDD